MPDRVDGAAEIEVVRALELGRQARLDAHFGRAHLPRLEGAAHHLVHGQEVALFLAMVSAERAEGAVLDAHVGEVDIPIHYIGHHVTGLAPPHLVGDEGEGGEVAARDLGQRDAIVHGQLAAVEEAAENGAHPW
jgi:hypothetical protein